MAKTEGLSTGSFKLSEFNMESKGLGLPRKRGLAQDAHYGFQSTYQFTLEDLKKPPVWKLSASWKRTMRIPSSSWRWRAG